MYKRSILLVADLMGRNGRRSQFGSNHFKLTCKVHGLTSLPSETGEVHDLTTQLGEVQDLTVQPQR